MNTYTLRSLCYSINAEVYDFPDSLLDRSLAGVSTDSRTVKPGDVFFALMGERFDGAQYVETAFDNGAILAVVNSDSMKPAFEGRPVVHVHDTTRALGCAARDYRALFSGTVVSVTGTSGKTTAKEMMLAVLRTSFNAHGTVGNYNNHIGLPLSVFGLREEHGCAVFELGMSAPGEISYLAGIASPHIGVVLNVGPAHMEFFPSLEAVADAKMELVESLETDGIAVVNGDDPLLKPAKSRVQCRLMTFGIESTADFRAENVALGDDGCAAFVVGGETVRLRVPGIHNVYNALAAFAVGRILGVSASAAADALGSFTAPDMRMEIVTKHGVRYINDSYNANPMSMKCAADVLRRMATSNGGGKIAVLGNMLELGGLSADAHHAVGVEFGSMGLKWLCLVGDSADDYMRGAVEIGMSPDRIRFFDDSASASKFIDGIREPGDVILVKGSRGMKMEKVLAH